MGVDGEMVRLRMHGGSEESSGAEAEEDEGCTNDKEGEDGMMRRMKRKRTRMRTRVRRLGMMRKVQSPRHPQLHGRPASCIPE